MRVVMIVVRVRRADERVDGGEGSSSRVPVMED